PRRTQRPPGPKQPPRASRSLVSTSLILRAQAVERAQLNLVCAVALGLPRGFVAQTRLAIGAGEARFARCAEGRARRAERTEPRALVARHARLITDGARRAFAAL